MTQLGSEKCARETVSSIHSCDLVWMSGHLEKGIQPPMAQGRSTKIITMIKWIRANRLSIKNSPSLDRCRICGRSQESSASAGLDVLPIVSVDALKSSRDWI